MAKTLVLGLDLGITSVGWALLEKDGDEFVKIVDAGVRVFESGGGGDETPAAERRKKRAQRRLIQRRRARRKVVLRILRRHGLLPVGRAQLDALFNNHGKKGERDPHVLRATALTKKLEPFEFGRAMFHLAVRRGFKSNRKNKKESSSKGFRDDKKESEDLLKDKPTWGSAMAHQLSEQKKVRGYLTLREWYEAEFKNIFDAQSRLGFQVPAGNHDDLRKDLHEAIFYQRPFDVREHEHGPGKARGIDGLLEASRVTPGKMIRRANAFRSPQVASCRLFKDQKRGPLHAWSVQRLRLVLKVNNLRVLDPSGNSIPLDTAQRSRLLSDLEAVKERNCLVLLENLGFDKTYRFNVEGPRPTLEQCAEKVLGKAWRRARKEDRAKILEILSTENDQQGRKDRLSDLSDVWAETDDGADPTTPDPKDKKLEKLSSVDPDHHTETVLGNAATATVGKALGLKQWERLGSEAKDELCRILADSEDEGAAANELRRFFETHGLAVSDKVKQKLLSIEMPGGYLSYSVAAAHAMLAEVDVGAEEPSTEYAAQAAVAAKNSGRCWISPSGQERLSLVPKTITNPGVRRTLGQLRKVVHGIIANHRKPDEIVIELARDLFPDKDAKYWNEQNREARERAKRFFEEHNVEKVSEQMIQKHRLWEEQDGQCPYSHRSIPIAELVIDCKDGGILDIDHIIPRSWRLDDSYNNLVLCYASENREKRNRTPFLWSSERGEDWHAGTCGIVRSWHSADPRKKKRFWAEAKPEELEGFISRHLNDTRYIARAAREWLLSLYSPGAGEGGRTVRVSSGGFTNMLRGAWHLGPKNRLDHRHHAQDAIIIACTTDRVLQEIAKIVANAEEQGWGTRRVFLTAPVKLPFAGFLEQFKEVIDGIVISIQPQRKFAGELHEAYIYGRVGNTTTYRREGREIEKADDRMQPLYQDKKDRRKPYGYAFKKHNHHAEFWRPEGQTQWKSRVVSRIDAMTQVVKERKLAANEKFSADVYDAGEKARAQSRAKDAELGRVERAGRRARRKAAKARRITGGIIRKDSFTLVIDDTVLVRTSEEVNGDEWKFYRVQFIATGSDIGESEEEVSGGTAGSVTLRDLYYAGKKRENRQEPSYITVRLDRFCDRCVKVHVDPLGRIFPAGD